MSAATRPSLTPVSLPRCAPPPRPFSRAASCQCWRGANPSPTAVWWTIFYGLALLSMSHFAPTGIIRLGVAFLAAGLLSIRWPDALSSLARAVSSEPGGLEPDSEVLANLYMAATFGLFHLAYAAAVAFSARRTDPATDV